MKPQKLFRRWKRRSGRLLSALLELLSQCRTQGEVEQIHQLRVTLRRLRLHVRIGRPLFGPAVAVGLRRWAGVIARATSRVRDYDVAMEWLQTQPEAQETVDLIELRRDRLWNRWKRKLPAFPARVAQAVNGVKGGAKREARLKKRFRKQEAKLEKGVREQMPRFFALNATGQHEFRRTLRWRRYLRELELPGKQQRKDPLLTCLVHVQEAIGEHQNRMVTLATLASLKPSPQLEALRQVLAQEQAVWMARTGQGFRALTRRSQARLARK